jgi:ADP-ribosylglycohydrolase
MTTQPTDVRAAMANYASRVRGCLLGGAIGDALGAPVEFWDLARIRSECGDAGVTEYLPATFAGAEGYGLITDDTQMTLFTVEGMIRASVRVDRGIGFTISVLAHAYDHWLDTQTLNAPDGSRDGWLAQENWLYSRRAPGATCLTALETARDGKRTPRQYGSDAENDSKGCGGVMRSAPLGLLPPRHLYSEQYQAVARMAFVNTRNQLRWQYEAAYKAAGYTHGHPTGKVASGALAVLVAAIVNGESLLEAIATTIEIVSTQDDHEETTQALTKAMTAALSEPSAETMESLGGGWISEEALAMAVYAALSYPEPDQVLDALSLAVTHSGDSDSTGAICGNILGALHGDIALPPALAFEVEGRGTILTLADDFIYEFTSSHLLHGDYGPDTRWFDRYPGW